MKTYPILGEYERTTLLCDEVTFLNGITYLKNKLERGCFLWIKNEEELFPLVGENPEIELESKLFERIYKLNTIELYEGHKNLWLPKEKIIINYTPLEENIKKSLIELIKINNFHGFRNLAGHFILPKKK